MISSINRSLQRTNRFARDLKSLPEDIQRESYKIAQLLMSNIFDPRLDIRELVGLKGYYRVVVAKQYRMIFSFNTNNIFLLRIAHRKDIYRKLEI